MQLVSRKTGHGVIYPVLLWAQPGAIYIPPFIQQIAKSRTQDGGFPCFCSLTLLSNSAMSVLSWSPFPRWENRDWRGCYFPESFSLEVAELWFEPRSLESLSPSSLTPLPTAVQTAPDVCGLNKWRRTMRVREQREAALSQNNSVDLGSDSLCGHSLCISVTSRAKCGIWIDIWKILENNPNHNPLDLNFNSL